MFAEGTLRSDRAPQHDARFGERGRNDRWIIGFLCKALLEKVRLRTPGSQSRCHGWRSNGEIEESDRGLIRLQFPRHQSRAFFRNRIGAISFSSIQAGA
jgi:hypothetical protein